MDYEKKYKEAIEKFDVLLNLNTVKESGTIFVDDVRKIFPELKWDEDEKIKELIYNLLTIDTPSSKEIFSIYGKSKEDVIVWLESKAKEISELDKVIKCLINGMKFYYDGNKEATWGTDKWSMPVKHIIEVLEKLVEKKPNNEVEPKFHKGDIIVKKNNSDLRDFGSFMITNITGGKYWCNGRIICDITKQDEWEIYEPVRQNPKEDIKKPITYKFKYYLKGNTNSMPTEFLVNWELSILENHLYILEKTLEEDDIYGYLKYIWQGYYGKEVYIDVYEKNVIKGSGPYYDLLFRFKVEGGKVWVRKEGE